MKTIEETPEARKHLSFKESLEKLNIHDYSERIFNSNSHGELMHLQDYIWIAENIEDATLFRDWFEGVIKWAELTWSRPESVFQHIPTMIEQSGGRRYVG